MKAKSEVFDEFSTYLSTFLTAFFSQKTIVSNLCNLLEFDEFRNQASFRTEFLTIFFVFVFEETEKSNTQFSSWLFRPKLRRRFSILSFCYERNSWTFSVSRFVVEKDENKEVDVRFFGILWSFWSNKFKFKLTTQSIVWIWRVLIWR